MGFNDSYPQSGNAYTSNVRANFTAIKNVLSQAALDGGWIRAEVVSSDPTAGNKGRIIFNETDEQFKIDDGSSWITLTANIKCGSYVGNGNDNRDITGLGFDPDYVVVIGDYTSSVQGATSDMPLDKCKAYATQGVLGANTIQDLITDGFQVGSAGAVNANGETYYYVALGGG